MTVFQAILVMDQHQVMKQHVYNQLMIVILTISVMVRQLVLMLNVFQILLIVLLVT